MDDLVQWITDPTVVGILAVAAIILNVIAFAVTSLREHR